MFVQSETIKNFWSRHPVQMVGSGVIESVSISLILRYADMETDAAIILSMGILVSFYGDIIK